MIYTYPTFFDCIEGTAELAEKYSDGLKSKILIFCEDKLTLSCELALADKTGGNFSKEVTSFGRYVKKRADASLSLSKEGSAMVVKKLLKKREKDLVAFKSLSSLPSVSAELSSLIAQLKSAKITPEELSSLNGGVAGLFTAKIKDIALVFSDYEEFLASNGLFDSNSFLSLMPSLLGEDEDLPETRVIFVGFSSLTRQSAEAVKTVYSLAKSCDFICVKGENTDIYTNEFYDFAIKLTGEKPIKEKSSVTEEALNLLDRLYNPTSLFKEGKFSDKVFLYEAKDVWDECETIASRIRWKILNGEAKYRDIAVAVGDEKKYSLSLKRKLSDYGIPFYSDEKRLLSSHPLFKLIKSLLRFCYLGGDKNELKNIILSSLFIPEKSVADGFIRELTEKSLNAESFLKGEGDLSDIYEEKRKLIADFFFSLKKTDGAENYVSLLKDFFTKAEILVNAEKVKEKLAFYKDGENADFLEGGIKKTDETLNETAEILGGETISLSEFIKILETGAEAAEISFIPRYYDSVYICELKNCRFKKYDTLFAVGLNSSVPAVKEDVALLSDGDIEKLEKLSVKVEPKIKVVNRREKEACCLALASFENELFLSYSASESAGGKSELLEYIVSAFSSKDKPLKPFTASSFLKAKIYGSENERENASLQGYLALRPALFSFAKDLGDFKQGAIPDINSASAFYLALKRLGKEKSDLAEDILNNINGEIVVRKNIPPENYFKDKKVSASILETYYSCPYKNFLKYGVGLHDGLTGEVRPLDMGNILHSIAEKFVLSLEKITSEEEAVKFADDAFDKICEEEKYSRFLRTEGGKYSASLVKKEAEKLCREIYKEFKNSSFKPVGAEIFFGDNQPFKALPLNTKKKGYRLHGKADRLDYYKDEDGKVYYRIIDYKTGSVTQKIKDESLYTGINLQLYLYLNALTVNGETPSGAYYYEVSDNFIGKDDKFTPLRGKTLSDEKILSATEKDFELNGEGKYIKAKYSYLKSGKKLGGEIADNRTIEAYMAYAKRMAEEGVNDVTDGVIIASPYENACTYCEFGSICLKDDASDEGTRKAIGVTKDTIVEALCAEEEKKDE